MRAHEISNRSGEGEKLNKHQLRTEATKRKLIEAAYEVFSRDGFEAARIEDIAALAGFTRGAYYAHFESKSDIFFALLEDKAAVAREKLSAVFEHCRNAEERRTALRDYYMRAKTDRQWAVLLMEFKLYALRHSHQHEELAEAHRRLRKKMSGWLRQYTPTGEQAAPETEEFVRAGLEAAYSGLLLERSYDPKRISEAQVRELLGKFFDALVSQP
ncbi:MAG TPA: TetR/AcrR family transcriptional regulator [Bryobacteraceae bacterium]|jgi:AcrR family transcriptional regulator|nr:TetR/AcrR family transcriptional regulator [Bryobacteraceae bacterium]